MTTSYNIKRPSSKLAIWLGVALVACLLFVGGCSSYNSLVTLDEKASKVWADVENQYQRRFDLIPNLVETVKGYARHESETLETVTNARAGLSSAYNSAKELEGKDLSTEASFERYTSAQNDLNRAFNIYVNAVKEAYPELKADNRFRDLQVQLESTENRIATERRNYTAIVLEYNAKVRRFPGNIFAGIFGFSTKPQFSAGSEALNAPKVSF